MKNSIGTTIFIVFAVLLFSSLASAQSSTAVAEELKAADVQDSCAHWAKLHVDKHKEVKGDAKDVFHAGLCAGYVRGLIDGLDNTGGWRLSDGTVAGFEINRPGINSIRDVIQAFYAYVETTPLSKGKPAWEILQTVLLSNGLAGFIASTPQSQPSGLSNECKFGTISVLTQLGSDNELKDFDTSTLASTLRKLMECSSSASPSDSGSALVFMAQAELESILLVRATNVMNHHSLLPEFGLDRSSANASGQQ